MAAQCSTLYATWLSRFHRLMAEIAEADLAVRAGRAVQAEGILAAGAGVVRFYESVRDEDIVEIEAITKDGLTLALTFRSLVEALGRSEGDQLYDLCDEVADYAEVLSISADADTITRMRSHLHS